MTRWNRTVILRQLNFLFEMTRAQVLLLNEGSVLGIFWYLLSPILTFGVLIMVFSRTIGSEIERYPLYLLLGVILWNFSQVATSRTMRTMLQHAHILKSLPIRKDILVLSSVFATGIAHLIELCIVLATIGFIVPFSPVMLLFPLVWGLQILFTIGLSFALAGIFLFFRDLEQIWVFFLRVWWLGTPVFYALPAKGGWMEVLFRGNPMTIILHMSRASLLYGIPPAAGDILILAAWSFGSLACGYVVFRLLEPRFPELV